jgi:aminoglycoside phosphotransferase (APT) family kinase protein
MVTCASRSGAILRLLIKYEIGEEMFVCGLPVGLAYEAIVYQQVLSRFAVTVPHCYGAWRDRDVNATALVLEYLDGVHADRAPNQTEGMSLAAAWIGRLHALAQPAVAQATLPRINIHQAEFYLRWAIRTLQFERRTRPGRTWLPVFTARIDAAIEVLRRAEQTVIHGDYYADNTLYHDGRISVFAWEHTALGPGEIDLASLTHGWHDEVVQAAEDAYYRARWPDGAPAGFAATLSRSSGWQRRGR